MGLSIDPENHLYQPGGAPRSMFDEDSPRPEPTNATTLPQAGPLSLQMAEAAEAARQGTPSLIDLDLDLDIGAPQRRRRLRCRKRSPCRPSKRLRASSTWTSTSASPCRSMGSRTTAWNSSCRTWPNSVVAPCRQGLAADSTQRMSLRTEIQDLDESPTTKVGGDSLMDAMQDMGGDDADPMMRQIGTGRGVPPDRRRRGRSRCLQELLSQLNSGPLYERAKKLMEEIR